MTRAALAVLAATFLAVGPVSAADPDTLGGTMSAGGNVVIVTSSSTVPVSVELTGDYVSLTPASFTLAPGESARATMTGPTKGAVSAHLVPVQTTGDSTGLVLSVTLKPPPPELPILPLAGLVGLLGMALAARRLRPWRWRIVTV